MLFYQIAGMVKWSWQCFLTIQFSNEKDISFEMAIARMKKARPFANKKYMEQKFHKIFFLANGLSYIWFSVERDN